MEVIYTKLFSESDLIGYLPFWMICGLHTLAQGPLQFEVELKWLQ